MIDDGWMKKKKEEAQQQREESFSRPGRINPFRPVCKKYPGILFSITPIQSIFPFKMKCSKRTSCEGYCALETAKFHDAVRWLQFALVQKLYSKE
jgi:hypothetical protein